MAIRIIEEYEKDDVILTQAEHNRLRDEFELEHRMYTGPLPSFEDWVRRRQAVPKPELQLQFRLKPNWWEKETDAG